jgi:hypothetical protein
VADTPKLAGRDIGHLVELAMEAIGRDDRLFERAAQNVIKHFVLLSGARACEVAKKREVYEGAQHRAYRAVERGLKAAKQEAKRRKKLLMGYEALELMAQAPVGTPQIESRKQVAERFGCSEYVVARCIAPARKLLAAQSQDFAWEIAYAGRARRRKQSR